MNADKTDEHKAFRHRAPAAHGTGGRGQHQNTLAVFGQLFQSGLQNGAGGKGHGLAGIVIAMAAKGQKLFRRAFDEMQRAVLLNAGGGKLYRAVKRHGGQHMRLRAAVREHIFHQSAVRGVAAQRSALGHGAARVIQAAERR